jgi:hypothetical protein
VNFPLGLSVWSPQAARRQPPGLKKLARLCREGLLLEDLLPMFVKCGRCELVLLKNAFPMHVCGREVIDLTLG